METKEVISKRKRKARRDGKLFELRVRKDLEAKGWIVDKWTNNIQEDKLVQAKPKFSGIGRPMMLGQGFPDFIAFKNSRQGTHLYTHYEVIGVEVKTRKYLDIIEKAKCKWLLEHNVFSKILIAYKDSKVIRYKEF